MMAHHKETVTRARQRACKALQAAGLPFSAAYDISTRLPCDLNKAVYQGIEKKHGGENGSGKQTIPGD